MNINPTPWHCDNCARQLQEVDLVEQKGDLLIYHCGNCGAENVIVVSHVPSAKPLDEQCVVHIDWVAERPTMSELSALRKLIPRFRECSMTELKSRVGTQGKTELGMYVKGEALDIQHEAEKLGLNVIITEQSPSAEHL